MLMLKEEVRVEILAEHLHPDPERVQLLLCIVTRKILLTRLDSVARNKLVFCVNFFCDIAASDN